MSGSRGIVGGLVGTSSKLINNCYATGDVSGSGGYVGGLGGNCMDEIRNCYATGDVSGDNNVGGLAGYAGFLVTNCYATGDVSGKYSVGGLAGGACLNFTNCYETGDVTGESSTGGLVGVYNCYGTINLSNSSAYGTVKSTDSATSGSLIGQVTYNPDKMNIVNCQAVVTDDLELVGGSYDKTAMLAGITPVVFKNISTNLQVGINSDVSNQISFDTNFKLKISSLNDMASDSALDNIAKFQKLLNEKSTELGAIQNRLESAFDEISVQQENLISSLSTIRDADIADESSEYIRQQILQQAASTLLATANQSPSIALQLI